MSIFSFISPKKPKGAGRQDRKATGPERKRVDSVREAQSPPHPQSNAHDTTPVRGSPQDTHAKIEATRSNIVEVKRKLSKRNLSAPATAKASQPTNATHRLEPAMMPAPLVVKESSTAQRPGIARQPTVPLLHEGQIKSSTEIFTLNSSPPSTPTTPSPRDLFNSSSHRPSSPPSPSPAPQNRPAPYLSVRTVSDHPASTPSRLKTLRRTVSQRLPKLHRPASRGQRGQTQPSSPVGISMPFNSGRCWDASSNVPAWRYESMSRDEEPPMLM